MKKLTKETIEKFAYEVLDYLTKHSLDSNVCIYFNNKKIKHEYNWREENPTPKLIVTENISPFDYFEYANYDHILSMSFEGPLYDVLNYSGGKREEGLIKIFEKYGCYWELGHMWNLSAYPINDNMEIEFTAYGRPKRVKELYMWDRNVPAELREIMDKWYMMSEKTGDIGSCTIGDGFEFDWNGDSYFMCPCSPYQGSISYETHVDKVRAMLGDIGASNIHYNYGRMD
jgi:hypothetical protein